MGYETLIEKLSKGKKEEKYFVSVVPVSPAGEVLLGKRTEDGVWTTPGGGANPGEEPHQAARRELFEEAGLVAPENALELVSVSETPRGYKIYSFLWRMPGLFGEAATSKLDPDKEVKKWALYRPEDFPAGMASEANASRLKTIREALMKLYGVTKADIEIMGLTDKLNKGGPGSGIKGHKTAIDHITRVHGSLRTASARESAAEKKLKALQDKGDYTSSEYSEVAKEYKSAVRARQHAVREAKEILGKAIPFEEAKHPRGHGGQFSSNGGRAPTKPSPSHPSVKAPPEAPINKLQAHLNALENGGVIPGLKTNSGKPVVTSLDAARAHQYDVQDHVDAMNAHYQLAVKTQEMLDKLKMAGRKIPAEGAKIAQFHQKKMRQHMQARDYLEARTKATAEAIKEQKAKAVASVKKSVTQMGGGLGDRDLDVGSFAQAASNGHSAWMENLYTGMEGFQYADEPRSFVCPKGTLTLAKVDDGLYTGFFTQYDGTLEDNARVRIERMTIPELVQFMVAKEWIANPVIDPPTDTTAEIGQLQEPAPGQPGFADDFTSRLNEKLLAPTPVVSPPSIEQRLRVLELIAKLIS